jgi:hypothetical protein
MKLVNTKMIFSSLESGQTDYFFSPYYFYVILSLFFLTQLLKYKDDKFLNQN